MPSKGVFENETLPVVMTSLPRYQDTLSGSQYAQANHPGSTSSTIDADKDGRPPIVGRLLHSYGKPHVIIQMKGQPIQLSSHTISSNRSPFHGDSCGTPLINASTHRFEGGVQDCASDNTAHASITHLSLNSAFRFPMQCTYKAVGAFQGLASHPSFVMQVLHLRWT